MCPHTSKPPKLQVYICGNAHLCAHGHLSVAFAMEVVILVLPIVVCQLIHTALLLRTIPCSMQGQFSIGANMRTLFESTCSGRRTFESICLCYIESILHRGKQNSLVSNRLMQSMRA